MTTRVDSKDTKARGLRLVLRDKPRGEVCAASMDGWRIEVNDAVEEASDGDIVRVGRPNAGTIELEVYGFVLAPVADRHLEWVFAAADPLFETIYVSRVLEGDEPDTLRRLMAEEAEREREYHAVLAFSAEHIASHFGVPPLTAAGPIERGQLVVKDADGTVRAPTVTSTNITINMHAPFTDAERAKMIVAANEIYPGSVASFRVPKVGEEIEVRWVDTWTRGRVTEIDRGCVCVNGGWYHIEQERDYWRWPEQEKPREFDVFDRVRHVDGWDGDVREVLTNSGMVVVRREQLGVSSLWRVYARDLMHLAGERSR
jgi:hypothetical protein